MGKWLLGKGIITAALVLGAAATASAADLQTEVGELAVALKARVDAGAGGKELKQLNKVIKKIDKKPVVTVKDLKKILGGVDKSATADTEVLDEAADVLQCLCDIVQGKADETATEAAKVLTASLTAKLDKKLSGAQAKLELAKSFVATEPARATTLLLGAAKKYEKTLASAAKFLKKEAPKAPPNGITFTGQYFINNTGKNMNLKELTVNVQFLDESGAPLGPLSGKATALIPENFEGFNNRIFSDGGLNDFGQYIAALFTQKQPSIPEGATHFNGKITFKLGNLAPFAYVLPNTPVSNFLF